MNSKLLRYVVTIAELRSFSEAAKKLYLSQPALSQSIIALERDLGTPLFDRSTVPISLTFAGEKYVAAARQILLIQHQLETQIGDIQGQRSGRLMLGVPLTYSSAVLPLIFPPFHEAYPDVNIHLIEATNDQLADMALSGELDLTFLNKEPPHGTTGTILCTDRLVLACGPEHPAFQEPGRHPLERVALDSFQDDFFILTEAATNLRQIINTIFQEYNFIPKVVLETHNVELALELVMLSPALTLLPELSVNRYPHLQPCCFLLDRGDYASSLSLCYRKNLHLTKVMKSFIAITNQAFSSQLSPIFPPDPLG